MAGQSDILSTIQNGVTAVNNLNARLRRFNGPLQAQLGLNVKDYGAVGDGSANDTASIQATINAAANGVIGVYFPEGNYLTDTLTLSGQVALFAASALGQRGAPGSATLIMNSTGFVIQVAAGHCAIIGLHFFGGGAGQSSAGIHIQTGNFWNAVRNCFFENFGNEAIVDEGIASDIGDILAFNCLLIRTQAAQTGVVLLTGTDTMVYRCELTASITGGISASFPFCAAMACDGGGNHFISDNVFEISDIGLFYNAFNSRITACRADSNQGHGFLCPTPGLFTNCFSLNNSQAGVNSYDGFNIASMQGGQFVNCRADGSNHRYGWGGANSFGSASARTGFVNCKSVGDNSGVYQPVGNQATENWFQAVTGVKYQGFNVSAQGATPSVRDAHVLDITGQGVLTVTNFTNGLPLQDIYIQADGNQTIANNANILTNTGANKLLTNGLLYHFKLYGGQWIEIGN